jgi:hypothetical protein
MVDERWGEKRRGRGDWVGWDRMEQKLTVNEKRDGRRRLRKRKKKEKKT